MEVGTPGSGLDLGRGHRGRKVQILRRQRLGWAQRGTQSAAAAGVGTRL